uniref:protein-tyrosine-phosphatase n=4 Tax=Mesocestoides corti TaxID=53468 RepID=A0A5K3ELN6_MESCO
MTFQLKGSYSVSAAENPSRLLPFKPIICNVVFLDDKSELFKLEKNARGQVLIDLVFDFIELLERDFFGLQYNDFNCNPGPLLRWLEPSKSLKKQLRGATSHTLWFRVKFYVPDPLWLQEEFTRYLVYLQVRKDVLSGSLTATAPILAKMAGLCLQSELGDYSVEDCKPGYTNHIRLVPNQTSDFEVEATEAHKSYRSYVPAAAELEYLNIARRLDLYGVHPQDVIDRDRQKLSIGVSAQGVSVFRDTRRIVLYSWDNIERISFSKKAFAVHLKRPSRASSLTKVDHSLELSTTLGNTRLNRSPTFTFDSAKRAKVFWQFAVTCHTFFRVKEPTGITAYSAVNGKSGSQSNPISATAAFSNPQLLPYSSSSPSGFSRLFLGRGARTRRSLSVGTAGPGLERTMSTLMELRRRSRSIERGFLRGVSRRFTRRQNYAPPGSTLSVSVLNAYESRDSLGMQSVPSLLGDTTQLQHQPPDYAATTPDEDITALQRQHSEDRGLTQSATKLKSDRAFPRKFRSSAPPLSRVKKDEPAASHKWDLQKSAKMPTMDNLHDHVHTLTLVKENGKPTSGGDRTTVGGSSPEQDSSKRKDLGLSRSPVTPRLETVLPRPTAFFASGKRTSSSELNKQSAQLKPSAEKSLSARRSMGSNRSINDLKYQHPAEMTSARSPCAAETSASPNCTDENLVVVRIRPNAEGQFGFNVNGGADLNKPVIVTRVGEEMPAGTCFPRLHPGDQVLRINGREISDHTHQQVVNFIRAAAENHSGVLELIVKPSDYLAESATDDHLPETGDAPPRPPKSAMAELKASANESAQAPIWLPTSALGVGGSPKHYLSSPPAPPKVNPKPRLGGSSTLRLKSTSGSGPKKILVSDTERLHHSIQAIENGLADGSLIRQFELLERRKLTATMLDAKSYENLPKNRYRDISPYDQTRVRIEGVTGDYINASFVKMSIPKANLQKEYIAAQGPLPNTCLDFWQMCWEQKSELIVMLTSVQEQGRFKCHKYWPDPKNTFEYTWNQPKSSIKASPTSGKRFQLRISNIKEEPRKDIFYREFQLQRTVSTANSFSTHNSPPSTYHLRVIPFTGDKTSSPEAGEIRRVVQLQYVTWPDHGVPGDCGDLIEFVEQMRQLRGEINSVPAVVHCSAGIGRTGVVILLDTAVDMIRAGSPVDPLEMVHQMRNYREMLIQTPVRYNPLLKSCE